MPAAKTPAANRAPFNAVDMALYGVTLLFWAFSWVAMHYQVGPVAPDVSIMWRFVIAAPIMLLLARLRGERLAFPLADHLRFAALGLFLFCLNFFLFYHAAAYVASGLLSVVVSLAAMLKLRQLRNAFCDAVMVSCEPFCEAVAEPEATVMPVGLAGA